MPPLFKCCTRLSERDAQLSALQAEHAKVVPALEARAKSSTQLEDELSAVRAQLHTVSAELKSSQQQASALGAQAKRNEAEIHAARADLAVAKTQASSYLELLRTRDWRSRFRSESVSRHGRAKSARPTRRARHSEPSAISLQARLANLRSDDCRAQRHDRATAKCRRGAGRLGR